MALQKMTINSADTGRRAVSGLQLDSRKVRPGDLFFALAGIAQHGLAYARQAVDRGAVAIAYDPAGGGDALADRYPPELRSIMIAVPELGRKLGPIADRFFGSPSTRLDVIGVTGTNGKTSCSHFLAQALGQERCGLIGTLGWGFVGDLEPLPNTTPDVISMHSALARLRARGAGSAAIEVSSHGLDQGRCRGVRFRGAVYTTISRDHLDYHGTMEAYLQAKLRLLQAPGLEFVVVNLDDEHSKRILHDVPPAVRVLGYSRLGADRSSVDAVRAVAVRHGTDGLTLDLVHGAESARFVVPVLGDFNVDNILATVAVLRQLGVSMAEAAARLERLQPVAGRMERLAGGPATPSVVVDYAHTPDALQRLLDSARRHCTGRLWLVFGCGGDRDRGKRPQMGRIARAAADRIIVTDDNPRFEEGAAIVAAILDGCGGADGPRVIRDRAEAIETAIGEATPDDMVVIAGKGHETYQEVAGVRHPFSDRDLAGAALRRRERER